MGHDENELEEREEEDVEKLEEDVNEMAQKILDYRTTLPDQLKSALASSLVAQRPAFPTRLSDGSEPGPSGCTNPDAEGPIELGRRPPLAQEDHDTAEKTRLLKQKISSNASALPVLLKRMKECISRIESRESCNEFIPPVFKRKKTS